jgi:hypothetical protein
MDVHIKLPGGQWEHQIGDPHCATCDAGWPQQHSAVAEHCCPGFVHAETLLADGAAAAASKVIYYCDMCYEDDPL